MAQKTIPNEKAIIDKILHRKGVRQARIPADKMTAFKEELGKEIERSGSLRQDFVDSLVRRLRSGGL